MNINDLKVTSASSGPILDTSSGGAGGLTGATVFIQGNQGATFVTGMPANAMVSATLSPSSGSGKALAVASGYGDALGTITLTFQMPTNWADGSKVESGTMTLTFTSGSTTMTAWVTYYTD